MTNGRSDATSNTATIRHRRLAVFRRISGSRYHGRPRRAAKVTTQSGAPSVSVLLCMKRDFIPDNPSDCERDVGVETNLA